MSRWLIEKSGTGIEKSGTGIEKSGTGIEKSGTGIEKSGTGLRKSLLTLALATCAFSTQIGANERLNPAGELQIVVGGDSIAVSWIIDGSVFSGAAIHQGSYANLLLTEVALANPSDLEVVGGGTGSSKDVVGGGTGSGKDVVGGGTGSSKDVVGGGTGTEVVGGGTGIEVVGGGTGTDVVGGGTGTDVVGGGTGTDVVGGGTGTDVVGGGTGTDVVGGGTGTDVVGGGTGSNTLVVGGGTGTDAISITLPNGTGLQMEVFMNCSSATVSVLDANYEEVVSFDNVKVLGDTGLCSGADYAGGDYTGVRNTKRS